MKNIATFECEERLKGLSGEKLVKQTPPCQFVPVHQHTKLGIHIHRLDQITPYGIGNKVYKLLGHIGAAERRSKTQLLSFGGGYSNHLHALAICASHMGWGSIGVVRGLNVDINNPTLSDVSDHGMVIRRVSKREYLNRHSKLYLDKWRNEFPNAWIVPEGGNDRYGRLGVGCLGRALLATVPLGETLVVPIGTGATVRGLLSTIGNRFRIVGVQVAKDARLNQLLKEIEQSSYEFKLVDASDNGFARPSDKDLSDAESLFARSGVLLDPIYGCKAFQVAKCLAEDGGRVHLLHTGGLQGWRGFYAQGMLKSYPNVSAFVESGSVQECVQ